MTTALAKRDEVMELFPILKDPESIRAIVQDNLGGSKASRFDLPKVTIPAAGGALWTIEGLEGPKAMKQITGIIIGRREYRVYWSRSLEESDGGAEPDCKSEDCIEGQGDPGGICADCPMSQFGSDPKGGDSQACKQKCELLVVPTGGILPICLDLPPSSLKGLRKFMMALINARKDFRSVVVDIGLSQVDKPVKHSVATFQVAHVLDEELAAASKAYANSLMKSLA